MSGMIYLSQLLKKPVSCKGESIGEILDLAVVENKPIPPVSKLVIKRKGKRIVIPLNALTLENNHFILNTQDVFLPYDEKDFYLNEDLLDKQVIDIDGKRLVRVNDVLLENNGGINVIGIDIGTGGIIRRLGLGQFIHLKSKTLPWGLIEAFDYNTGAIRISLTQNRLNKFHSSEIADIIEQAGIKERLGIVGVLDVKKAARAIEELNNETQVSILQQISTNLFKNIIGKMLLSEIADVFYRLNPLRVTQILNELGQEKTTKIEKLSKFSNNVAGGIMDTLYYQINSDLTIKELLNDLTSQGIKPESIIVTNGNDKLVGIIDMRTIFYLDPFTLLKDIVNQRKFIYSNIRFSEILRLFSQYNLRMLPVVNKEKHVIGVVRIDKLLSMIEQEQEEKNAIL